MLGVRRLLAVLIAVCMGTIWLAAASPAAAATNLISDGQFNGSSSYTPSSGGYTTLSASPDASATGLPGWTVTSGPVNWDNGPLNGPSSGDTFVVDLSGGTLEQTVTTTKAQAYTLSFAVSANPGCGQPVTGDLEVDWNHTSVGEDHIKTTWGTETMVYLTKSISVTGTGSDVLDFIAHSDGTSCGPVIGDVTLVAGSVTQHTLTASPTGARSGTVTSDDGVIDCAWNGTARSGVCSADYGEGDGVQLTATPATGMVLADWSGAGCSGQQPSCVATIGSDQTVNADFEQGVALSAIATSFPNPIGITYFEPQNKLLMSVNYSGGIPNNFDLVSSDGTFSPLANPAGLGGEIYPAGIRTSSCEGGFTPGDVYYEDGANGAIAKLSASGVVTDPWVTLPGETGATMEGLTQDVSCSFGGDLIATTTAGDVWRISSAGVASEVATGVGDTLEAPTTVPNDPKYGPWAGKVLAASEGCGCVQSIAANGSHQTWNQWPSAEGVHIVPPNENFFGVDYGAGSLQGAPASEFTGLVGDVLINTETPGKLMDVKWNSSTSSFDTYDVLAPDVGQWEGVTFAPAGLPGVPDVAPTTLTATKTADSSSVGEGASDGYTIKVSNPNSSDATLSDITDTLPDGFSYTTGSSTNATTTDPAVSAQKLTWSGPFTVPANGSLSLHFSVTVSSTAGTYYNNAGGDSADATVAPTGNTAPVTVTAPAKRSTTTTVVCDPLTVAVGSPSSCTATVTDTDSGTATTPTGSVSLSSPSGNFDHVSCTLSEASTGLASCAVSYTPSAAGVQTITGDYGGDGTHATSSGQGSVTALGPLTTSKTADASSVTIGSSDGYTIKVSNPNSSSVDLTDVTDTLPAGFSYTAGSSTGATTVDPTVSGQNLTWAGPITIPAGGSKSLHFAVAVSSTPGTYDNSAGGDSTIASVTGTGQTAPVTVRLRATSTSVSCSPNPVGVGVASSCTVTVSDTDSGTKNAPTGTILFASSGAGGFSPAASCTLGSSTGASASCQVSYTPSGSGGRTDTITTGYQGDTAHAKSAGNTPLGVSAPAPNCSTQWCYVPPADLGRTDASLGAVSCPSTTACVAVGSSWTRTGDTGSYRPLVERWDGSGWSVQQTASLGALKFGSELSGVSCSSASVCMAVGRVNTGELAERWNGKRWTDRSPTMQNGSELSAVSCPSAKWCMAVGKQLSYGPLAERWTRSGWESTKGLPSGRSASLNYLYGVSCTSATDCIAVGEDQRGPTVLIERWDGHSWSELRAPSGRATLLSVSCASAEHCDAVGRIPGNGPLAERWDGSSWKITPMPGLTSFLSPQLNGIDCPKADRCEAAGGQFSRFASPLTVVTSGGNWTRQTSVNRPGYFGTRLLGVACASTTWCMAVGDADSPNGEGAVIERYAH